MSGTAQYFLRQGSPVAALATAVGGPVAIIRLSGRDLSIYNSLFSKPPVVGAATYTKVADLDKAVVLSFRAPHSFTGEDVLEIQCHGVKALLDGILEAIQKLGGKLALPGEFSFRAVMNGKMTLEEAEALNTALSDSSLSLEWAQKLVGLSKLGEAAAKSRIEWALKKISVARGRVEAAIDYPEAEAEQASEVNAAKSLVDDAIGAVQSLRASYDNFAKRKSGLRMLILGSPNVGKSTLLNLLAGGERALVSDEAGTTRDFIETTWRLRSGLRVTSIDTAGIRFGDEVGKVEVAGVQRALSLADEVDVVVHVRKAGDNSSPLAGRNWQVPVLELFSHADKVPSQSRLDGYFDLLNETPLVVAYLDKWLSDLPAEPPSDNGEFWISARQAVLMESALRSLGEADLALSEQLPIELCGQFLLEAESHLRRSVGEEASQDYIGEIFSQFCLGK